MQINEISIDRFSSARRMIGTLTEGQAKGAKEDTVVKVNVLGVRLGEANILTIFPRELPTNDSPDKAWKAFCSDLKSEGFIPPGAPDDEAQERARARAAELAELAEPIYRVEYQSVWDPVDDWRAKLDKKLSADAPSAAADEADYVFALGGRFMHAEAKYTIFYIQDGHVQGEAIFDDVKPHVVRLPFDQLKGYEPPQTEVEIADIELTTPEVAQPEMLAQKYEKVVEFARSTKQRCERLEAAIEALNNEGKSVSLDMTPYLEELARNVAPGRNRQIADLKAHFVNTMQVVLVSLCDAASKRWPDLDHAFIDQSDMVEDLVARLEMGTVVEFDDLAQPQISKGQLKLKLSGRGAAFAITAPMKSGARDNAQAEMFEESDFRPKVELEARPDEPKIIFDDYGVQMTDAQYKVLTDDQRERFERWKLVMTDPRAKTKKTPAFLLVDAYTTFQVEEVVGVASLAYRRGVPSKDNPHTPGTAQHTIWGNAWQKAKKADAA